MQYSTTEGVQGICPVGWHIPTESEWCIMENNVDVGSFPCNTVGWNGTDVGNKLKETGTAHWQGTSG